MTKHASFKQRIRARMQKTGERYTSARAMLLLDARAPARTGWPGLLDGLPGCGGIQGDTAILAHVLAQAGIVDPGTGSPYDESMLHGLCGGIGFLLGIFEYSGHPPMVTLVPRSRSMPDAFLGEVFGRIGVERELRHASSDAVAARALDECLAAGRPAVCVVDRALLPHTGMAEELAGMNPHHVAVVGAHGDEYWIEDRALRPLPISAAALARARAGYRKAKRALWTVSSRRDGWSAAQQEAALRDALRDTADTLENGDPTVPANFRKNCGLQGMEKWLAQLVAPRGKQAWVERFGHGERAFIALVRSYECIQHEYTAPAAGRPLYADFVETAAARLEAPGLEEAARAFRSAGELWNQIGERILAAPDEAVQRACALSDRRAEALDAGELDALAAMFVEQRELQSECRLQPEQVRATFEGMGELLAGIVDLERGAVAAIQAATRSGPARARQGGKRS